MSERVERRRTPPGYSASSPPLPSSKPSKSKSERAERGDRADRADRDERQDRVEMLDRDRPDRPDRSDRQDRSDRHDRSDRPDRSDKLDRSDRPDRSDRQDRADRAYDSNPAPQPMNTDTSYSRPPQPSQGGEAASYGRPQGDAASYGRPQGEAPPYGRAPGEAAGYPPHQGETASYPLRPGPPLGPSLGPSLGPHPGPGSGPGPVPAPGAGISITAYTGPTGEAATYYQPAHDPSIPGAPMPPLVEIAPAPLPHTGYAPAYNTNYNYPPPQQAPIPYTTTAHLPLAIAGGIQPMLKDVRMRAENTLKEYVYLQKQRRMILSKGSKRDLMDVEDRLRGQAAATVAELRRLKWEVSVIVEDGEKHRWRRWLMGGAFACFIPLVKKLFYEEKKTKHTSITGTEKTFKSLTEYAFVKSKALVKRILDATGRPGIYSVAFFVFSVLYIFTNEVTLRAARSVNKRVKRLLSKVESGDGDMIGDDIKLLRGWRWRVLEWAD